MTNKSHFLTFITFISLIVSSVCIFIQSYNIKKIVKEVDNTISSCFYYIIFILIASSLVLYVSFTIYLLVDDSIDKNNLIFKYGNVWISISITICLILFCLYSISINIDAAQSKFNQILLGYSNCIFMCMLHFAVMSVFFKISYHNFKPIKK